MSKTIVLGGGCFWCIEAIFEMINGVSDVTSGYAGGDIENPTYHNHGNHAEVVQITYDDSLIPLEAIFDIFFHMHDPTTINRQGHDVGTQYRSIVLFKTDDEKELAEKVKKAAQADWEKPIVTEIRKLDTFYPAEDYHQDFYKNNASYPYCQVIIDPKLQKLKELYGKHLKQ